MDENDFEGTIILERIAEINRLDDFFEAIDADDFIKVKALLKKANTDQETIQLVLQKMKSADDQH